jgi:hypothetical protein
MPRKTAAPGGMPHDPEVSGLFEAIKKKLQEDLGRRVSDIEVWEQLKKVLKDTFHHPKEWKRFLDNK